jgi:hypothetical protein
MKAEYGALWILSFCAANKLPIHKFVTEFIKFLLFLDQQPYFSPEAT